MQTKIPTRLKEKTDIGGGKVRVELEYELDKLFDDEWPGSHTVAPSLETVPVDSNFPLNVFVLNHGKEDIPDMHLIAEMIIQHPNSTLEIHYKIKIDKQKKSVSLPDITMKGIFGASRSEIRGVFRLLDLLRSGNVKKTKSPYSREQQLEIARKWRASGLLGNEEQDKFAEKYGISGRTLRNYINKLGNLEP